MADYVPHSDETFTAWLERLNSYVSTHAEALGLTPADVQGLEAVNLDWSAKYGAHVSARLAAQGACDMKDHSRVAAETFFRPLVQRIQSCPTTTDEARRELGITVRGSSSFAQVNLGTADDRPVATINSGTRRKHILRFANETAAGIVKGRPSGVLGAEIFLKVGDAPSGPSEMQCIGIATAVKFVVEFDEADGGKLAHYMMRWVTRKGQKGSWSETESVTIGA